MRATLRATSKPLSARSFDLPLSPAWYALPPSTRVSVHLRPSLRDDHFRQLKGGTPCSHANRTKPKERPSPWQGGFIDAANSVRHSEWFRRSSWTRTDGLSATPSASSFFGLPVLPRTSLRSLHPGIFSPSPFRGAANDPSGSSSKPPAPPDAPDELRRMIRATGAVLANSRPDGCRTLPLSGCRRSTPATVTWPIGSLPQTFLRRALSGLRWFR